MAHISFQKQRGKRLVVDVILVYKPNQSRQRALAREMMSSRLAFSGFRPTSLAFYEG